MNNNVRSIINEVACAITENYEMIHKLTESNEPVAGDANLARRVHAIVKTTLRLQEELISLERQLLGEKKVDALSTKQAESLSKSASLSSSAASTTSNSSNSVQTESVSQSSTESIGATSSSCAVLSSSVVAAVSSSLLPSSVVEYHRPAYTSENLFSTTAAESRDGLAQLSFSSSPVGYSLLLPPPTNNALPLRGAMPLSRQDTQSWDPIALAQSILHPTPRPLPILSQASIHTATSSAL